MQLIILMVLTVVVCVCCDHIVSDNNRAMRLDPPNLANWQLGQCFPLEAERDQRIEQLAIFWKGPLNARDRNNGIAKRFKLRD